MVGPGVSLATLATFSLRSQLSPGTTLLHTHVALKEEKKRAILFPPSKPLAMGSKIVLKTLGQNPRGAASFGPHSLGLQTFQTSPRPPAFQGSQLSTRAAVCQKHLVTTAGGSPFLRNDPWKATPGLPVFRCPRQK